MNFNFEGAFLLKVELEEKVLIAKSNSNYAVFVKFLPRRGITNFLSSKV